MILILININNNEINYLQKHEIPTVTTLEYTELTSYINSQVGYKLDEILLYHSSILTPSTLLKPLQFPDENPLNAIILLFKKKLNKHTRKITPFKYQINQSLRHLTH